VTPEDVEAVAVERQRQAVLGGERAEHRGEAVRVFGRAEVQGDLLDCVPPAGAGSVKTSVR
jgi:hypothetical protein